MVFIKDNNGKDILAFDGIELFYKTRESDDNQELEESISIKILNNDNTGAFKLFTILELQKELGLVSDINFLITEIKSHFTDLAKIIENYERAIKYLEKRIVLEEIEGSSYTSSWIDRLYVIIENNSINLYCSKEGYLSASEKIEYYGLEENEYWTQIQANGEFIEDVIIDIKNANELFDSIVLMYSKNEGWGIDRDQINWTNIINCLENNKETNVIGYELKSFIPT
jgi:hypothetical protein